MNRSEKNLVPSADVTAGAPTVCQNGRLGVTPIVPRAPEEIQDWFLDYLAGTLQIPAEKIDLEAPFEVLGLDSVSAVGMSGDLQTWLGFSIDPMVVYDYPTIDALAGHLAECSQMARPAA
jgi:acyl carrier protein